MGNLIIRSGIKIDAPLADGTGDELLTIDAADKSVGKIPNSGGLSSILPAGLFYLGNASNLATPTAITGAFTVNSSGVAIVNDGVINDQNIASGAGITYSKLNLVGSIINADIATGAGIAKSKLESGAINRILINNASGIVAENEAIIANRLLVSDSVGLPIHSTVTAVEASYLSGVTSALQPQFADKLTFSSLIAPIQGDLIYYNGSNWVNLPKGTTGQYLISNASTITWTTVPNGIIAGGTAGQYLSKVDGTDFNTEWSTLTLSKITNVIASAAQVNALATGFYDATSSIQTQLTGKQNTVLSQGAIWVGNASNVAAPLTVGTNGHVLTVVAGLPTWQAVAGTGTVTSITGSGGSTGLVLVGGPITSSGTLTLGGILNPASGGTGLSTIGTSSQVLRTNIAATGLEWFTPNNGDMLLAASQTSTGRKIFSASGTSPGINIGAVSINNFDSAFPGDMWYETSLGIIGALSFIDKDNQQTYIPTLSYGTSQPYSAPMFLDGYGGMISSTISFDIRLGGFVPVLNSSFSSIPAFRIAGKSTDPALPDLLNGDVWYNTTTNSLKARIDGITVSLGAGGGLINSAANNELMLSNGTNAVASGIFKVTTNEYRIGTPNSVSVLGGADGISGNEIGGKISILGGNGFISGFGSGGSVEISSGSIGGTGLEGTVFIQGRATGKISFFNAAAVTKRSAVTSAQGIADALTAYGLLPTSIISGGGGLSLPISDATALLSNSVDPTKLARFELGQITTGTQRNYTFPNVSGFIIIDNGNQTITGTTTFTGVANNDIISTSNSGTGSSIVMSNSSSGNGIRINNVSSGKGIRVDNTNATSTGGIVVNNSAISTGLIVNNSSGGFGVDITNSSSGFGLTVSNTAGGIGINLANTTTSQLILVNNSSSGTAFEINSGVSSTGDLFIFKKNAIQTGKINNLGEFIIPKLTIIDGTQGVGKVLTSDATGLASWQTAASGFANPMTTLGDIIYGGASGTPTRLGIGSTNQVLTVIGGIPTWATGGGGFTPPTLITVTGTTYTISAGDNNAHIYFTNAGAITVTLPNGIAAGSLICSLFKAGAGDITLVATGTLNSDGNTIQVLNTGATVYASGTNTWGAYGSLGAALTLNNITGTLSLSTGVSGTLLATNFPALTGDITTSAGSLATTLATVASAGTTGSSTAIPVITINAKGLTTNITTTPVIAPAGTLTGTTLNASIINSSLTSVGILATLTVTAPITGSVTGSAASFTGSLVGEVTGTQGATIIGNTAVINKVLTGYVSGTGTVVATDTILQAIQKLNGNNGLKANIASPTFTGTVTLPAGQVINGVILTTGGSTNSFLNASGTYTVPAGGGAANYTTTTVSGTSYTISATDDRKNLEFTAATAVTITLPTGITPDTIACNIIKKGAGVLTFTTSGTLNSDGTTIEVTNTGAFLYASGTNTWTAVGSLGAALTLANITGSLSQASVTNLVSDLALKASLASPTFTGTVTLPASQVINGVTLQSGGSTSLFLNQNGTYTVGGGGITRSILNISTTTTAGNTANTDYVYNCTNTITLTLPTAIGNINRYTIKNSGLGAITINTTSSQTIDGGLTAILSYQYLSVDLVSNGSNWIII